MTRISPDKNLKNIDNPKLKRKVYVNFIVRHENCKNNFCKKDIEFCIKQIAKLDAKKDLNPGDEK